MSDYASLQERYRKELDRGYDARRKGGIAWKQHCAASATSRGRWISR